MYTKYNSYPSTAKVVQDVVLDSHVLLGSAKKWAEYNINRSPGYRLGMRESPCNLYTICFKCLSVYAITISCCCMFLNNCSMFSLFGLNSVFVMFGMLVFILFQYSVRAPSAHLYVGLHCFLLGGIMGVILVSNLLLRICLCG